MFAVLARSVFEHAVNYRCAMIYGYPRIVSAPGEVTAGLRLLSEHMAPGQWDYARQPNRKELAATRLLAPPLDEASVKARTGPAPALTRRDSRTSAGPTRRGRARPPGHPCRGPASSRQPRGPGLF